MISKEQFEVLLERIKTATGLGQEAVSEAVGYKPTTITELLSGGKNLTSAYKRLSLKYGEALKNSMPQDIVKLPTAPSNNFSAEQLFAMYMEVSKTQTIILRNIESKMATEQTLERIIDKVEELKASSESLSSGHQLVAIRQAVDRGILLRSLARLEGKKNDHALLSEADSKINEIEAESVRLSKRHAADKSSTEKSK